MEEQKLLKRKKKALNGSNKKVFAEICNELGNFYNGKLLYENAIMQYTESANVYEELNMPLEKSRSHRMIGEMYMLFGEFDKALYHEDLYLSITRELNDKVEEQRALATLGRTFLLQGQSLEDPETSRKSLKSAEKTFMKSLLICESLRGKINSLELMDMRARLLLNIGVVLEHMGSFDKAVTFLEKAIVICKSQDLFDLLNQCYVTEGVIYFSKQNDYAKALLCFNYALEIAGRLENKVARQCEALLLKGNALCMMSDFYSAKSILKKAWKLKSPDPTERSEIEKKLKIVVAICYTEDLIVMTHSANHAKLKEFYEKLGDGACSLKNYQKGVDCYLKMLEHAEKNGDSGKLLVPIYVSLYQTYKDMKNYEKALEYQRKEFNIIQDDHAEAYSTLLNIADTLKDSGDKFEELDCVYRDARLKAIKCKDEEKEIKVLNLLLKHHRQSNNIDKVQEYEKELSLMGKVALSEDCSGNDSCDDDDDDNESQNTPNIGDDICLDDITDISDDECEDIDKPRVSRKRGKGFTIKKNAKGETQLHQACISGNSLLVSRLISQGHPVNIRDNAGWLPLHEACIHGKKDIVEILIKNGAHINDRGGTQCDGITPIHDAAGNGFLEIVELLLDNGASPSIKNDHGETVLDVLKKWRSNEKLNTTEQIFYETLCARVYKNLEKVGEVTKNNHVGDQLESNNSSVVGLSFREKRNHHKGRSKECCESSLSEVENGCGTSLVMKAINRNNIIDDDSSNSSVESSPKKSCPKYKNTGVREYKNAMESLRNRHNITEIDSDQDKYKEKTKTKKGAFLDPDEVGDDWLEDDLVSTNSKKRKRQTSNETVETSRRSKEYVKSPLKCDDMIVRNKFSTPQKLSTDPVIVPEPDIVDNLLLDDDSNSLDDDMENIPPSNVDYHFLSSKSNFLNAVAIKEKKRRPWKRQLTLIKSGFTKNKTDRPVVRTSSCESIRSDAETCSVKSNISTKSCVTPVKPDSTTDNFQQNLMSEKLRYVNVAGNAMSYFSPSQQSLPPAAVKVRIQDKLLLIPVSLEKVDSLTISWLTKEASRRYYNIEGVQPSLTLLTSDGALLADEDPLALVIGSSELQANITSWNLPPLSDRYIECCVQFKLDVDEYIRNMLDSSQATHTVNLKNLSLSHFEIQPIFKSLNHQTNLTTLLLSNNCIGNNGLKYLAQCLPSLLNIRSINLSENCIDSEGVRHLLYVFEKSSNPVIIQNLIDLDLSYNPLEDIGFIYIIKLSKHIKLKSLNLRSCNIDMLTSGNDGVEDIDLKNLESLDISFNNLSMNVVRVLLHCTNPYLMHTLKMEDIKVTGDFISTIMENCQFVKLKELDLSRSNLTDADLTLVLRSVSSCENLQVIKLSYNSELTGLSLKKLLQFCPSLSEIDLEGCQNIFKYLKDSDPNENLFRDEYSQLKSLKFTANVSSVDDKVIQQISNMWIRKWDRRAYIDKQLYGQLNLSFR